MKRQLALLLSIVLTLPAATQAANPVPPKMALVSLIGDVLTVDTYRMRTGTSIDRNHQDVLRVPTPVFDQTALAVAADAVYPLLPEDATVATLAVPKPGSNFDPNTLLDGGRVDAAHPLVAALRQEGFGQLLMLTKHRAAARFGLADGAIGSGEVEGLGFYVDPSFKTQDVDSGKTARGFIAPYVHIRLTLLDLERLLVLGSQTITASELHTDPDQAGNPDPWAALSAQDKAAILLRLLKRHVAQAVPPLLSRR